MGIQGAAIATICSFAIGCIFSAYFGRKYFSLPFPLTETIKIVIATLVMFFCLWWLKDFRGWIWLLIQFGTGLISFFIMMLVFNVLEVRQHLSSYFFTRE